MTIGAVLATISLTAGPAGALAARTAAAGAGSDQAKLQLIINRGNNEISRRLGTLNKLSAKITGMTKLTDADKTTLTGEITDEINGLTALKTKLDGDTTVADARADAQSIINDYRVYALVMPKVFLVKTADDQQVAEARLTALAVKLQARIDAAKSAGKSVTALTNALANMNSQINAAQAISSSIESSVVNLQPSDYNSNHRVLSGDRDQLKTAQSDIKQAVSSATSIVAGLKNL